MNLHEFRKYLESGEMYRAAVDARVFMFDFLENGFGPIQDDVLDAVLHALLPTGSGGWVFDDENLKEMAEFITAKVSTYEIMVARHHYSRYVEERSSRLLSTEDRNSPLFCYLVEEEMYRFCTVYWTDKEDIYEQKRGSRASN